MKKILFILALLIHHAVYAQLVNWDFADNCGTNSLAVGTCNTWASGCIPNWDQSHGAPLLVGPNPNQGVKLTSANISGGQGIFSGFSFYPNNTYTISAGVCVSQSSEVETEMNVCQPVLNVYACNGLTSNMTFCIQAPPTPPSSSILIATIQNYSDWINLTNTGTVTTFTNTTTDTYTQLWLSLSTIGTCPDGLNGWDVTIYCIDAAADCKNGITVSTSPPSNSVLQNYTTIDAGASLGMSTALVQPTGQTIFTATDAVSLIDGFLATSSDEGDVFTANTGSCYVSRCKCHWNWKHSLQINSTNVENNISVYPNPTTGLVNINSNVAAHAVISDVIGHKVLETQINSGLNQINLSNLDAGMYFISIKSADLNYSNKIMIQH